MSNNLDKATNLIQQGWCRENLIQDGKVCSLGAIAMVEMNIDTRLLEMPHWNYKEDPAGGPDYERYLEDLHKHGDYENKVYKHLEGSASVKALADQIRTTNWYTEQIEGLTPERAAEEYDDVSVIWAFNDDEGNSYEDVVLNFKHAAVRMDNND